MKRILNRSIQSETDTYDFIFEGLGLEKFIIASNVVDICIRLKILLGLNLSGHTHTLTKSSNPIDDIYKRSEKQNEQQYRNAPDKFQTN